MNKFFYALNSLLLIHYFVLSNQVNALVPFTAAKCGIEKSCLRWSSCLFNKCDYAVSWKPVKFNSIDYLEIELIGMTKENDNQYIALGFSDDDKMGLDGVVGCSVLNSSLEIRAGHNPSHRNILLSSSELDQDFLVSNDSADQYGVEFDSNNKLLRCRFLRKVVPHLSKTELKDLSDNHYYYLLTAKGPINQRTAFSMHYSDTKRVSIINYNLNESVSVNNIITHQYTLVKTHGCFMVIGWLLFLTNGVIISALYKHNWPNYTSQKEPHHYALWFKLHVVLQFIGLIFVCVALILVFVCVRGWSQLNSLPDTAHPIIGLTAFVLLLANPIMALFRCSPRHHLRPIFDWAHKLVGISAIVLAVAAMCIGIRLPAAGPKLIFLTYPTILILVFLAVIAFLYCFGKFQMILNRQMVVVDQMREINNQGNNKSKVQSSIIILILSGVVSIAVVITLLVIIVNN